LEMQEYLTRFLEDQLSLMVVQNDKVVYASRDDGIAPLLSVIESERPYLKDALVIDKVVGRAAALLICYGEARGVYATLLSEKALKVLHICEIGVEYDRLVPYILNRDSTDMCPFERLVEGVDNPEEGYRLIAEKWQSMEADEGRC